MEKSYDFSSNGATVPVTPGEIIRISLGENPSTGYRWNVSLTGDLVITGEEYGSSNIIGEIFGLVGGGGTRTWHLEAGQAGGTQKFTAILKRPWMPTTGDEKTFEITFQVGTGRK
jgi:predicted secreted protein